MDEQGRFEISDCSGMYLIVNSSFRIGESKCRGYTLGGGLRCCICTYVYDTRVLELFD